NAVGVPGEDLPHVSHFFTEAHPYWQQRVVVIGGGNSAVEAALDLHRVGARVTLIHFLGEFDRGVKPWILPDVTNRVKDGSIAGVLASGLDANKIFIENGRAHGALICEHIKAKPPKVALGG